MSKMIEAVVVLLDLALLACLAINIASKPQMNREQNIVSLVLILLMLGNVFLIVR